MLKNANQCDIRPFLVALQIMDILQMLIKFLIGIVSGVEHHCLVVLDGIERIVEARHKLIVTAYAKTYERKNPHFGSKTVGFNVGRTRVGSQQSIELFDKLWEYAKNDTVNHFILLLAAVLTFQNHVLSVLIVADSQPSAHILEEFCIALASCQPNRR